MTVREQYELEQRLKRINNRDSIPPEGIDARAFYEEQYRRRMAQVPQDGNRGKWTGATGESVYIPSDSKIKKILEKYGLKE